MESGCASVAIRTDLALIKKGLRQWFFVAIEGRECTDLALIKKGLRRKWDSLVRRPEVLTLP